MGMRLPTVGTERCGGKLQFIEQIEFEVNRSPWWAMEKISHVTSPAEPGSPGPGLHGPPWPSKVNSQRENTNDHSHTARHCHDRRPGAARGESGAGRLVRRSGGARLRTAVLDLPDVFRALQSA